MASILPFFVLFTFLFFFFFFSAAPNRLDQIAESFHARYHTFEEIGDFISRLYERYPNSLTVHKIGDTYEGRPIKALEIIRKNEATNINITDQTVVFLECGIHAREWISPASCLWVAEQLLKMDNGEELDKHFKQLQIPSYTKFFIIPHLNPDGYVYSWTNDRGWRKNRVPHVTNSNQSNMCYGTDLNRNTDHDWLPHELTNQTEKVPNPFCLYIYPGSGPFSEKETQALRDFVLQMQDKHRNSLLVYIAVHSFGQQIILPYGHTWQRSNDYVEHMRVARLAQQAIKSLYGKDYEAGPGYEVLYEMHGTTIDYFYDKRNIRYSLTIELRPRRRSPIVSSGFLLPPEKIVPTAQELWAAIATIASNAMRH